MKIFKKISDLFKRKRSFYYSRRYYYSNSLNKYEKVNAYLDIAESVNHPETLYTHQTIQFSDSETFEKDQYKYFIQKYGSPHISITNKFSFGKIKIIVYQINIDESKVILELHFFNQMLFMYSYNFPEILSERINLKLLNIFCSKYLLDFDHLSKNKSFLVKNHANALISVNQELTLRADYLPNLKSEIFALMQNYKANKEEKLNLKQKAASKELQRRI